MEKSFYKPRFIPNLLRFWSRRGLKIFCQILLVWLICLVRSNHYILADTSYESEIFRELSKMPNQYNCPARSMATTAGTRRAKMPESVSVLINQDDVLYQVVVKTNGESIQSISGTVLSHVAIKNAILQDRKANEGVVRETNEPNYSIRVQISEESENISNEFNPNGFRSRLLDRPPVDNDSRPGALGPGINGRGYDYDASANIILRAKRLKDTPGDRVANAKDYQDEYGNSVQLPALNRIEDRGGARIHGLYTRDSARNLIAISDDDYARSPDYQPPPPPAPFAPPPVGSLIGRTGVLTFNARIGSMGKVDYFDYREANKPQKVVDLKNYQSRTDPQFEAIQKISGLISQYVGCCQNDSPGVCNLRRDKTAQSLLPKVNEGPLEPVRRPISNPKSDGRQSNPSEAIFLPLQTK